MLFTSYQFVVFMMFLALPLRYAVPTRFVPVTLLVLSYAFYLSWSVPYTVLLAAMTLASYGIAKLLARPGASKKTILALGVTGLLVLLSYFKYSNFVLAQLHVDKRLDVVLPLGISFFVFEMISYLVDVYRGTPPAKSLLQYFVYIAYFPHLIAGPIVRANELLPQLERPRKFDGAMAAEGVFIALVGFVKKMVFADNLGLFADAVFKDPTNQPTFAIWLGVLAYTGQIFCDFSGYTDIARGASLAMGIELPDNFDYPYNSTSITEFWRRWHMTLSRWLRDYLYISLGGNRHGKIATYRNLFLTMLLGGLWHGASWTFVAWGAWHGVLLALHKLFVDVTKNNKAFLWLRLNPLYRAVSWLTTFFVVVLGWVLFRAQKFDAAEVVLRGMFKWVPFVPTQASNELIFTGRALIVLALVHVLGGARVGLRAHRAMPPAARGILWASMIAICYLFAVGSPVFIYFQF